MIFFPPEQAESGVVPTNTDDSLAPSKAAVAQYGFTDLDGHPFTVQRFRGQALLVNFWATWCGPCVAEMPTLDKLAARYKGRGLTVLSISIDHGGAPVVAAFFTRHKLSALKPWLDFDDGASRVFHLAGVPVTYLLGPDGAVLKTFDGQQDWLSADMLKVIDRALPRGGDQDHAALIRTDALSPNG